jgi:uncharacterized membrane protein
VNRLEAVPVKRVRIESIDIVRGAVMILMALDHVRDFFGHSGVNPTDLASTTVPLFFTRWITHFCAPVFFLLTGTGAYLSLNRKSQRELSYFLFTRGLWLIFLELVPLRCLGFQFNFDYRVTMVFVLWALGWAMIVLSALAYLPDSVVTAFGVVMIATHNLLDPIQSRNPLWTGALDVRIAEPSPVPRHRSTRMGILSPNYLCDLGWRRSRAVSAVPMVCSLQAAPQRFLAQLLLNADAVVFPNTTVYVFGPGDLA